MCCKALSSSTSNALSFYVTKTVLVGPKWFWSDQIDLDLTIMIWSWPKWNGHDQNELVRSKLWFSTKMNHIWTWPIHFGRDHFILFVTKSLWSSPNQFGQIKTILDRPKLFWSHRRTRHKSEVIGSLALKMKKKRIGKICQDKKFRF